MREKGLQGKQGHSSYGIEFIFPCFCLYFFKERMFKIKGKQVVVEKSQKHPTGWPLRLCCWLVSSCKAALCEVVLYCLSPLLCPPHCSAWFCRRCFLQLEGLLDPRTRSARATLSTCGTCSESSPLCLGDPRATPLVCVPNKTLLHGLAGLGETPLGFCSEGQPSSLRDFWVHLLKCFF